KSLRENALDSLIERELILSEFVKLGAEIKSTIVDQDIEKIIEREPFKGNRDKFIEDLRKTGMTMKRFRDMRQKIIAVEMMRSRQAKGISVVTPQKLTETYQQHKDKFREETFARIRTIMIPKATKDPTIKLDDQRKLITEIREKTIKGVDFAELAKEHSKDSVSDSGGDRGIIGEKSIKLRNDLKIAAFALDSGKVSEVLEDNYAFYLLKSEDKKRGQNKSLNDPTVRDEVNKLALLDLRKSAYERWITKLKKTASIRQFDSKGKLITKFQKPTSE
ncbi:peptidylprolyl isomerase, partial [Verrucomicrobiales bacterium]|nr:peptidylprolyl isomerase [Verrucomicrobiales bacterium]